MAFDNTNELIKEFRRLTSLFRGKEHLFTEWVDFNVLRYSPMISEKAATNMSPAVLCMYVLIKQPFYPQNKRTLNIMKARYKRIKSIPGFVEVVKDYLNKSDLVLP